MSRSMDAEIAELRSMRVAALVERYAELCGKPPRCRRHAHLWRRCAWKLMERRHGGLSRKAKGRLEELIAEIELPGITDARGENPLRAKPGDLAPGTILTREWRGREVRVSVRDDGTFEHEGEVYTSLSAAARGITGSRWNGRLFFGLTNRKKSQ